MMDSLSKCFNTLQERYESILEAKPIYRDDFDMTLPLNESEEVSVVPTKKYRCLQRAKRIDQSLRFEAGDEEDEQKKEPLAKPRKVVRFQLENNKIIEPKKAVRFDLDHELEPKEKPLEQKEGLNKVEGKEHVVRVKIKMTKQEAQRLFSKSKNDSVLDLEHLVDQIAHVSVTGETFVTNPNPRTHRELRRKANHKARSVQRKSRTPQDKRICMVKDDDEIVVQREIERR